MDVTNGGERGAVQQANRVGERSFGERNGERIWKEDLETGFGKRISGGDFGRGFGEKIRGRELAG